MTPDEVVKGLDFPKKKEHNPNNTTTEKHIIIGYNHCVDDFQPLIQDYQKLGKTKECCKYAVISHGIGLSGGIEEIKVHCKMNPENDYTEHLKEYLSYKDFELKVKEILTWDGGIGSTDQDLIKWKTHEIMKLAEIPIDRTKE